VGLEQRLLASAAVQTSLPLCSFVFVVEMRGSLLPFADNFHMTSCVPQAQSGAWNVNRTELANQAKAAAGS
jgi:hypothetical protein